ncbi:MAG: pyruvate dehydrogenase (acetyl-transferring), homodimeric type [Pirellulales bacterium]|nr:pyruvate dehydrogenase (acetyl-transferring), homodimeric type [Pirellulales bacterium]
MSTEAPTQAARGTDNDPQETAEWIDSLRYVLHSKGADRVRYLLSVLKQTAHRDGVEVPFTPTTPYINTIPTERQPVYPGNRELERRIKSFIRWNAMAMVVRGNRTNSGIGGHISTYASAATLYEVAFNHFFRGRDDNFSGDQIYFQGHASPGIYARAFLEGRLTERDLENFRLELEPEGGLSSYPHPWLMPGFWEFPTVSMGLAPIMAIYQARFNKYISDRGIKDTSGQRVWAFLGDGETDEPETLGAITLASREKLDNLIFVVNCNLQRLDGPVRGNGKIIQELEGIFRGAGWNVIKVIWGGDWDPLLDRDESGQLAKRMEETVDGQYQKYVVSPGSYIRENFFGKYPELLDMVSHLSDEALVRLNRGGHDPDKVYAAYKAAIESDRPTVILAKTIKGYGLGEAGEGRNITHQQKKLNDDELREFRTRFGIPISDDDVAEAPFYKPQEDSAELKYLMERREELGGPVPTRPEQPIKMDVPTFEDYADDATFAGSDGKEWSTTMGFVRFFTKLLRDKRIGNNIVPIVPDESRTFGMEGLFRQVGIYSHAGQLYEPVDAQQIAYYKEAENGQLLEEGITEAGSMSSFIAAGTSYATHGINMIPFFIYYSMFGFQRIGDLIWAACDARTKGFMLGATAGRTTLNGEGLQHQDGHSHLIASAFPSVRCFDPAYAYETTLIILDGLKKMYVEDQPLIYYITLENEGYAQPALPDSADVREGVLRGMYRLNSVDTDKDAPRVQLLGSGALIRSALEAQKTLANNYGIASDVWSVTSYQQLRREAVEARRWNLLHPQEEPRQSYLEKVTEGVPGPFIATSDYVRQVPEQIAPWLPGGLYALGTDGLGRSDRRDRLRRFFEVDAESVVLASLSQLSRNDQIKKETLSQAIKDLDIDPAKANPLVS